MARFVIYETATGLVTNIVEWDGVTGWRPPTGSTASRNIRGNIGDTFNPTTGVFTPPVPSAPVRPVMPDSLGNLLVTKGVITPAELDTTRR